MRKRDAQARRAIRRRFVLIEGSYSTTTATYVYSPFAMSREATFRKLIADFPTSPMGYFSLGRLCLEERRFAEAVHAFQAACARNAEYTAAWVGLGDAYLALSDSRQAKAAFEAALNTPHGKKDASLQDDLAERLREIE
jgi:tetratricopeptide (TPR) repeat protein